MVNASSVRNARFAWRAGLGVVVAGVVAIVATPATAGPSSTVPGALALTSSALPSDVLPGESVELVVVISNIGGSALRGVTLTEDLPAALTYVRGSTVATRTSASGATSTYSDALASGSAATLGAYSPGLLISEFDHIDLAAGDALRVGFLVTVSPALAPGIDALSATSIATSGGVAVARDTVTLAILEEALAWASDDADE